MNQPEVRELLPGDTHVMQPIQALWVSVEKSGVPPRTLGLIHLRAGQINGWQVAGEWKP